MTLKFIYILLRPKMSVLCIRSQKKVGSMSKSTLKENCLPVKARNMIIFYDGGLHRKC